jgi:phage-related protein
LYSDEDSLEDVEDKINEVIDRHDYSKLDFNKIPSTFVNSVLKLGKYITKGSRCENCVHAITLEYIAVNALVLSHNKYDDNDRCKLASISFR